MIPQPKHLDFMNDLKAALGRHVDLSPPEMLAIASQFVGVIFALQDQTTMTPGRAMKIVAGNIEIGNQAAIEGLMLPEGSA
jgi:hypothetical protein